MFSLNVERATVLAKWKGRGSVFDMSKVANAVGDLDERLTQIANQGRITNGLLALLVLQNDPKTTGLSAQERSACIALARMAFNDPSSIVKQATEPEHLPVDGRGFPIK